MSWLSREIRGKQVYLYIVGCVILHLVHCFSVLEIADLLRIKIPPIGDGTTKILTPVFPFYLAFCVCAEEFLFRLPLAIPIAKGWKITWVLASALVLSVIFGAIHGGITHIFIQGVGGFMYSILFLKCGGLQQRYRQALAVTTATHFLFDVVTIGIEVARGATSI